MLLAGAIFAFTYALIVSERVHRTVAALLGATLLILLRVIDQHDAFAAIDLNVIFLLAGMMIIANILAKTGIFQWIAVEAVRRSRGRPYRLLVEISLVTAVMSAFLDNVTTVVLLAPVTFFIADRLRTSPVPFLISMILASNIGGAATLIGDPPNILIGSAFGKDFNAFLLNMGPAAAAALLAYLVAARWLFRRELAAASRALDDDDIARLVAADRRIKDVPLMRKSLAVLGLTVAGFFLSRPLGLEVATIALAGAIVLMLVTGEDVHEVLRGVEWTTLFFFVGLFILVEGLVQTGIITEIARAALGVTGGRTEVAALLVLWMSAFLSAIVDNIPYTVAMIPLVQELGRTLDIEPLIWALTLGADFGGNATLVGASANIIVASMSESRGHPITFRAYLRYGIPATLITMIVATLDIVLRYVVFR